MTADPSTANADFWNEPCGSQAARMLGVTDASIKSLRIFDDWYLDFYPYLKSYIPFADLKGKDVLEVGLGYGTVSQLLAEPARSYVGLDIASGPVQLVNHRLQQNRLAGHAELGNILEPPFSAESFDFIIAIGCLHHTGDLETALARCYELLRNGGTLIFMVYSAYAYKRWIISFVPTFKYWLRELGGYRGVVGSSNARERAAYDINLEGLEAPHTDFVSKSSLRFLCRRFRTFRANYENINIPSLVRFVPRNVLLRTPMPRLAGPDVYAEATK